MKFEPKYFVLAALAVIVVVSILLKEERVKRIAIGSLIGWFAAISFVTPLMPWVAKIKYFTVTQSTLQLAIFGIVTLLIGLSRVPRDKVRPDRVSVKSVTLMLLTIGSIALAVLTFLPNGLRDRLVTDYNLVAMLYNVRVWWMMATVGCLVLVALWPRAKKSA